MSDDQLSGGHEDLSTEEALEALRASEFRFRIAASHTVDLIQEVDLRNDQMTYHGDIDRIFGYQPGEFPRSLSGWVEVIHPEDRVKVTADVERALTLGVKTWRWRYRLCAGDGTYRHLIDHGTFVAFDEAGRPTHGVGCVQDVTEEVERELELRRTLEELAVLKDRLAAENIYLREELGQQVESDQIIGDSAAWRRTLMQARVVASTDSTVLLEGETGTGKEILARFMHSESERAGRGLIRVNCASLPSTLIESELFGHEKGAFSGADRQRKGRFELADGGTIFLDEIGEMPLDLQPELLRVLETGEFERVGSSETRRVDVRVIAATNRDLKAAVEQGHFRSDLYYRVAVFPIEVPPLRERREDIPLLAMYFLAAQNARHGKAIVKIPDRVLAAFEAYDWPGNVRELENMIARAAVLTVGDTLYFDTGALHSAPDRVGQASRSADKGDSPTPALSDVPPQASLEEVERTHIVSVLESCGWKVKGRGNAAEQLGLNESTLRSRMKRLGISRP